MTARRVARIAITIAVGLLLGVAAVAAGLWLLELVAKWVS